MKCSMFLSVLAPFALAVSSTTVHADDFNFDSPAPTGGTVAAASPAPSSCCNGAPSSGNCLNGDPSSGNCCECCGPGTNPWDGTVKAGFGLRMSGNYVTEQTGATTNTYNFFNTDDARIYLSGSAFGGLIKGTLNTEITGIGQTTPGNLFLGAAENGQGTFVSPNNNATVNLLDGICQFEFNDRLNFWIGRFLPPTDRANLDGPFYQTPYDYPFVSNYPSLLDGRDDGAAYWGQAWGGKLKWQFGMFNGIGRNYDPAANPFEPNATGEYMYFGRVTVNLLDPEPGYYTQSCYFGEKEILAIGMTAAFQRNGGGTTATPSDFNAESVDLLWEHRLGNCGVIDVECAAYKYDYGIASAANAVGAIGGGAQGTSEYYQFSYLLPHNICFCGLSGKLQPFARYQHYAYDFKAEAAGNFDEGVDLGVNWVISGYNARVTVAWGQREVVDGTSFELLRTGVQLQF
jgi:hypothetical protein